MRRTGIAAALAVAGFASVWANQVKVEQDRVSALYVAGETATFRVRITDDGGEALTNGVATWTLDNFGTVKVAEGTADLATGNPFVVRGKLDEPGFLRLTVRSGKASAVWSVGYDVGGIRQDEPRPVDFDAYWAGERARLRREVPLDPRCEKVERLSTADWMAYRISFATFNAKRVWGFMTVPTKGRPPFRCRVRICDAGGGATGPWDVNADEVTVTLDVLCFEPGRTGEEQAQRLRELNAALVAKHGLKSGSSPYAAAGIGDSREDYFFHDALCGLDRAIDWLAERPEIDPRNLVYYGSSQGGGFGLYVNYLNPRFARAVIVVPAATGHYGFRQNRQDGWPGLLDRQPPEKRAAAEKYAAYFDGVNFAAGIRTPVRFIVGFSDTTCPPPDVYAAYNACPSADKAIVNCIGAGHCGCLDWLKRNPGAPTWIDHAAWLRGDAAEDGEAAAWPWRLTGRTTKEVPFFEPGETMAFEVDLAARRPLPAGAQIEIERTGDDGRKDVKREPAVAGRTLRYETALAKPGFVRVLATLVDAQGRPIRRPDRYAGWCEGTYFAELGAGVRPEKLQSVPEPGDFDAFMASERDLLAKVPLKARLTSVAETNGLAVWGVRIDCAGSRPVTGYLTVPLGAREGKRYPARLSTQGWGTGVQRPPDTRGSAKDVITLEINAHGYELARDADYYKAFFAALETPEEKRYAFDLKQNSNRETAYFRGMRLRVMRALQYLKTRPEWNGADLWAYGASQGGLQTVWAASCGEGVTKAEVAIPWCCDIGGTEFGRNRGDTDRGAEGPRAPWYVKWTPALGYYDAVNHARRVPPTCDFTISRAGLGDYVCPPAGVSILYNNLRCRKSITYVQGSTHGVVPPPPNQKVTFEAPAK